MAKWTPDMNRRWDECMAEGGGDRLAELIRGPRKKEAEKVQMIDGELQEEFGDEFRMDMEVIRPQSRPVVPIHEMREAIIEMNKTKRDGRKNNRGRSYKTPEQVADAVRMYAAGDCTEKIGKHLGVSAQTVINWLRAEGVTIRDPRRNLKHQPAITVQAPGFGAAVTEVPVKLMHVCDGCESETPDYHLDAEGMRLCDTCWADLVRADREEKAAAPVTILDDEPAEELPRHLQVSAKALVKSIDEHNASQPRYHHAEDNLEEFLREYFGNLAPKRLYQLPEHIREAADKLTRALFEGRAA